MGGSLGGEGRNANARSQFLQQPARDTFGLKSIVWRYADDKESHPSLVRRGSLPVGRRSGSNAQCKWFHGSLERGEALLQRARTTGTR